MAYTGTYEQELRKNPTDYKLRAMGKRRYNLKRKKDERGKTKVTVSRDDVARTDNEGDRKRIIDSQKSNKSKSLLNRKGSGTQQTNYDDIRKKGQEGTPSGEKARESKSADARKGGDNTGLITVGTPLLAASVAKIASDAKKIGGKNVIIGKDGRPKLLTGPKPALEDRSKTMNVNKEGEARQGNNQDEPKKETKKDEKTTEKDQKKDKRKTKETKLKKKIKKFKRTFTKNKNKVVKKAKEIGKKAKPLTKGLLKRVPGVGLFMAKKAGASSLEDLSVEQLKKMGASDAQIKQIKGQ
tara:strand:- start:813 stop:1703 length:891 start_codon:yes stop_codon:yes gene_type:complete